jgi:hypothetical protein
VTLQRLPLDQAAIALGCSLSTIRRRIRTGTLQTERERHAGGYRLLVLVDQQPSIVPANQAELEQLRYELGQERTRANTLLRLLEREQERSNLLTHQLVQLTSPRHETVGQNGANGSVMTGSGEQPTSTEPARRSWWRLLFRGP